MLTFLIPLKSKQVSNNWENTTKLFNRTLYSAFNQTCPDFRVLVACHEIPELYRNYDGRVEFITSDSPIPKNPDEMMLDKGWKIHLLSMRLKELGAGYTMALDSDDLVSNRLAEYVKNNPNKNGFISKYGYVYNEGDDYVQKMAALYRTCGSCIIVNYSVEDLPVKMPENFYDGEIERKWIIRKCHRDIPKYLEKLDRELSILPFPSTIYIRSTGDNHSMLDGGKMSWKRYIELEFRKKIRISKAITEEFSLLSL